MLIVTHPTRHLPERHSAEGDIAHSERNFYLVAGHGIIAPVTVTYRPQAGLKSQVALVSRRHIDFKRVCSCCCLP